MDSQKVHTQTIGLLPEDLWGRQTAGGWRGRGVFLLLIIRAESCVWLHAGRSQFRVLLVFINVPFTSFKSLCIRSHLNGLASCWWHSAATFLISRCGKRDGLASGVFSKCRATQVWHRFAVDRLERISVEYGEEESKKKFEKRQQTTWNSNPSKTRPTSTKTVMWLKWVFVTLIVILWLLSPHTLFFIHHSHRGQLVYSCQYYQYDENRYHSVIHTCEYLFTNQNTHQHWVGWSDSQDTDLLHLRYYWKCAIMLPGQMSPALCKVFNCQWLSTQLCADGKLVKFAVQKKTPPAEIEDAALVKSKNGFTLLAVFII